MEACRPQCWARINWRRLPRFLSVYCLTVGVTWLFDYLYMPWLGIKFQHLAVIPLYFSLLAVSWVGLRLYLCLGEDVFFLEKINNWLADEGSRALVRAFKGAIRRNPKATFMAIAAWWGPLCAYLFIRNEADGQATVLKRMAEGAVYCSLFWGLVIDVVVLIWKVLRPLVHS